MNGQDRTFTLTGLIVTGTVAAVTLVFALTACVLFFRGDIEGAKEAAERVVGALSVLVALLSRTRPDPPPTVLAPTDSGLAQVPTSPVPVAPEA